MRADWDKCEMWRKRGNNFLVEVKHFTTDAILGYHDGGNRWCVYAYIYPDHPRFKVDVHDFDDLPLHWGESFFEKHWTGDCTLTSIQIGADYNHLGDERFTFLSDEYEAGTVFNDADKLFAYLSKPNQRLDSEGRDVTNLPGLWAETDRYVFQKEE